MENLSQHIRALPIQQTDVAGVSKLKISRLSEVIHISENDNERYRRMQAGVGRKKWAHAVTYNFSSVVVVDHVKKGISLGDLLDRADVLEAQTVIEQ